MKPAGGRGHVVAIAAIVAFAIALRLLAYSPWDQHHADEFYQYLEEANRLVTGYGLVSWESHFGIRGALIPQFLALPIWLGDLIAPNGMLPIHLARAGFAALCLLALAGAWGIGAARSRRHALVALFVAAIWYDSVAFSVLVLSESAATALIACGAALLLVDRAGGTRHRRLAGFLLVLGCLLRLQYAPFVAVLVLATARTDWRVWRGLALGGIVALALGAASDLAAGRVPMLWMINNVRMNLGQGRAAEFGQEGLDYYPRMIALALGPAIPAILAAAALAGRRYWPLILALTVNLAVHLAIGHKEYRFVWLSVFLILVLAAIGSVNALDWLLARRGLARVPRWLGLGLLGAAWFGLSQTVVGEAATTRLGLRGGAYAMAAHEVAARPQVCGLAVPEAEIDHVATFLLRRNVPIYMVPADMADGLSAMPPELVGAANAAVAEGDLMLNPEYLIAACHTHREQKVCLLVRPGGCARDGAQEYDYQTVMVKTGM